MDTVTQALFGAAIGQACFSRQLGRHAIVWGAVAGLVPDLDVVVVPFLGRMGEFAYHRGITHAFWFGPVVGPVLGYATWRGYRFWERWRSNLDPRPAIPENSRFAWVTLWVLALFTHPLLDNFTAYGTQFYAPFADTRVAWNAVGIIDPFYSIWLILALAIGWRWNASIRVPRQENTTATNRRPRAAGHLAVAALAISTAYLFYGLHLNQAAAREVNRQLRAEDISAADVNVYPTLLQPYLRRVVVRHDAYIRVGYLTMWKPAEIQWAAFPQTQHPLARRLEETPEGQLFTWFAMGQTHAVLHEEETIAIVELHDIRYGFPQRPQQGMWGIRAHYSPDGELIGEVEQFDLPPPAPVRELLREMWLAAFALQGTDEAWP